MAKVPKNKLTFSRQLRRSETETEKKLWFYLRSKRFSGFKFRRQRVVGPYIADFCCLTPKLIIELDGSQHLENGTYDQDRTAYLGKMGFRVIRFWDNDVFKNTEEVLNQIHCALTRTLSHPSDGRGTFE